MDLSLNLWKAFVNEKAVLWESHSDRHVFTYVTFYQVSAGCLVKGSKWTEIRRMPPFFTACNLVEMEAN